MSNPALPTNPASLPQRTTDPKLALQECDQLIHRGPRMDFALRPSGSKTGQPVLREVIIHPGAVIILPILDDGRIVMIRNRRHTVHEDLYELPAGTLEKGEDPATCAPRELTEETGYTAGHVEPFGWFFTSPGVLTEKMYVFIARDLHPGPQQLEDNELIRVELHTPHAIRQLIRENLLVDAKSIATLLKYWMKEAGES